jgi:hypothetical protein
MERFEAEARELAQREEETNADLKSPELEQHRAVAKRKQEEEKRLAAFKETGKLAMQSTVRPLRCHIDDSITLFSLLAPNCHSRTGLAHGKAS